MAIKDPIHPEEITPEWITHALRDGGLLKEASVKSIEKKILGESKGFLSSVVQVEIEYDTDEKEAPASVVVKIEPEEGYFRDFGDELNAFQRELLMSNGLPQKWLYFFYHFVPPLITVPVLDSAALFEK